MTNDGSAAVEEFEQDQRRRAAALVEAMRAAGIKIDVNVDGEEVIAGTQFRMQGRSAAYAMDWATDDQDAAIENCITALIACMRVPPAGRRMARAMIENTVLGIRQLTAAEGVSDATDDPQARSVSGS